MNSKQKGKRGELELAKVLRGYGFDARRGQQFKGGEDSPDVVGIEGYHIECKRCEKISIYDWMAQAKRDAGENTPIVVFRKNKEEWLVTIRLEDFIKGIRI